MATSQVKATSTGPTAAILINLKPTAWLSGVSLIVSFASGSGVGTAKVEISNDPLALSAATASQATWIPHDILNNITGDTVSNLAYPVAAVRLNVTAYTSGSMALGVGQTN